jgi:hypothetical protein
MPKKELRTWIDIDAPPERLWEVLMDFKSFPDWNPFMKEIKGDPKEGEQLQVLMKRMKGKDITIKPTVMKSVPNKEFRWLGKIPGFHGEHIFEIQPKENGIRFIQREVFTGFLVPFIGNKIVNDTRPSFDRMNHALKHRVEGTFD